MTARQTAQSRPTPAAALGSETGPVPPAGSVSPPHPSGPFGGSDGPLAKTCRNCSGPLVKRRTRHGLCDACFQRWNGAGRPDVIPDPMPLHEAAAIGRARMLEDRRRARADRKAALASLLATGMPLKMAARLIGVAHCTAARYRQELVNEVDA